MCCLILPVFPGRFTQFEYSDNIFHRKKEYYFAIKHYKLQNECADYPVKLILTKFKDNYYGDSWMHEWGYEIRINSRFNDYRMIRTIFHEMTHVKQFALGELELGTKVDKFKGKKYKREDYWNAPWEVEARKAEKKMMRKWKKVLDSDGKF